MVSRLEEMEHLLAVNKELEQDVIDLKDKIVELEEEIRILEQQIYSKDEGLDEISEQTEWALSIIKDVIKGTKDI